MWRLVQSKSLFSQRLSVLKPRHFCPSTTNRRHAIHSFSEGQKVDGFVVQKVDEIKDFDVTAIQLVHEQTGAQYIHIDSSDSNNTFAVGFRTPPEDSTGVAHILEHTTLCGSKRYPVRDPFFNMIKRSLNTFMNAFTASDWTMYPFSTQNLQDYRNLMSVYLDATFFPNLSELDFRQEGFRYEFEDQDDPSSSLMLKGIVYNEMKGAMSDSSSIFVQGLHSSLFPTSAYHHNSGGEPDHIPDLTYEYLRSFHRMYYHPSNARIFSYGKFAPELAEINKVLNQFSRIKPRSEISSETRFDEPKFVTLSCPEDPVVPDPEKQTKVIVAFLCNTISDVKDTFGLNVLSSLLLDGPKAPFYKSLIEPNIGSGYSPCTGYECRIKESIFGVGLQGISGEDAKLVEQKILETLQQVAEEGFEEEMIEAVIHQIELEQKRVSSKFGLNLILQMIPFWNHEADPLTPLRLNKFIADLREELSNGPYFQNLIRKYMLNNTHKVTLLMSPDADYLNKKEENEKKRVTAYESQLDSSLRDTILKRAKALEEHQSTPQDIDCLPTLSREDIPLNAETVSLEFQSVASTPLQLSQQPTNGIVYIRGLMDSKLVPDNLRQYLPLFTSALTSMGTQKLSYEELSHEINLRTGGIASNLDLISDNSDLERHSEYTKVSGHALERNIPHLLDLMQQILTSPDFSDASRLQTIVADIAQSLSSSLQDGGIRYALNHVASQLSPLGRSKNELSGLQQVLFMNALSEGLPDNIDAIREKLNEIANIFLPTGLQKVSITGDEKCLDSVLPLMDSFLAETTSQSGSLSSSGNSAFEKGSKKTYYALPIQVNSVASAIRTVSYTHPDAAKLRLLATLMTHNYLHQNIREKGGAYGGGASQSIDGLFSFYSYRDPNCLETVSTFQRCCEWATTTSSFSDRDMTEATLSLFSDIDTPTPPSQKGQSVFVRGLTDEMKQEHRERLLSVTQNDLVDVADRYLLDNICSAPVTVVGPEKTSDDLSSDNWIIEHVAADSYE